MNPIEWLSWLYGKFFAGHMVLSYVLVVVIGGTFAALLWARAIDKYKEQHSSDAAVVSSLAKAGAIPVQPDSRLGETTQQELEVLVSEYESGHPGSANEISKGHTQPLENWINKKLKKQGKKFIVKFSPPVLAGIMGENNGPTYINGIVVSGFEQGIVLRNNLSVTIVNTEVIR